MDVLENNIVGSDFCSPFPQEEVIVEDPETLAARAFFTNKLTEKLVVNAIITFIFGLINGYITSLCSPSSITNSVWLKFVFKSTQALVISLELCEVVFYSLTWHFPADYKQNNISVIYSFIVLTGLSFLMLHQPFFNLFWKLSFLSIIVDVLTVQLMIQWGIDPLMTVYEWSLVLKLGFVVVRIIYIFAHQLNLSPPGAASGEVGVEPKKWKKSKDVKRGSVVTIKSTICRGNVVVNCFGHLPNIQSQVKTPKIIKLSMLFNL